MSRHGYLLAGRFLRPLVVASVLAFFACDTTLPPPRFAERVSEQCPADGGEELYFRHGSTDTLGPARVRLYTTTAAQFLSAISANPLWCGEGGDAYRFIWLHDYRPALVISLHEEPGEWNVNVAQFLHPKTGQRRTIDQQHVSRAGHSDVDALLKTVEDARLWQIPAWVDSSVNDGSVWLFELRANRGYRVVVRHAPTDPSFIAVGRLFVRLAKMTVSDAL